MNKPPETTKVKNPNRQRGGKAVATAMREGSKATQAMVLEKLKPKKKQPVRFSQKLWDEIIDRIAGYEDLIDICQQDDMPAMQTVRQWYRERPELKQQIREAWQDWSMLGHAININIIRGGSLSTGDFKRDELLVKENHWHMSRTNRRDFADNIQVDANTNITVNVPDFLAKGLANRSIIDVPVDDEVTEALRMISQSDPQAPQSPAEPL